MSRVTPDGAAPAAAIMEAMSEITDSELIVSDKVTIPLTEIELRTSRSSGPGGQHANKTESRVEAVFDVYASTALTPAQRQRVVKQLGPSVRAIAQDARSQTRNRDFALERLAEKLEHALRPRRSRIATKPTSAAKQKRLDSKRARSAVKSTRRRPTGED